MHLGAVHPQQQLGVVDTEALAGGVLRPQAAVHAADPGGGPFDLFGGAVADRADEVRGAQQAAQRILPEVRVLHHGRDRARVQGLQVEARDAGHPHGRVGVQLPGHGARSQQPHVHDSDDVTRDAAGRGPRLSRWTRVERRARRMRPVAPGAPHRTPGHHRRRRPGEGASRSGEWRSRAAGLRRNAALRASSKARPLGGVTTSPCRWTTATVVVRCPPTGDPDALNG